jgi:hypothetical protein
MYDAWQSKIGIQPEHERWQLMHHSVDKQVLFPM